MATALRKQGGVTALVVGGCCELNADAHRLLAEIGALRGRQAARESGEGERACGALELLQLRQRMSVRIWSSYQRYICARVQYADCLGSGCPHIRYPCVRCLRREGNGIEPRR